MKRAIVLSGGGAKGAYEIGVWRALRKLGIKYHIVTGTSVGALNGAMMTQKSYRKALKLWEDIDFSVLFNEDEVTMINKKKNNLNLAKVYLRNIFNGGMNITKLENLVKSILKTKKIVNSKIDFGIITFNISNLTPIILTNDQMEEDKIADYLIASASCFPFFSMKKIDNLDFIDGGYVDNLPINLAIELGATEIIAVDLKAPGVKSLNINKNIDITYIKPVNNIGSFLVFTKEQAEKGMKYGYNDTMKMYNKLMGNKWTYKKFSYNLNKRFYLNRFKENINSILTKVERKNLIDKVITKNFVKKHNKNIDSTFDHTIEYISEIFGYDDFEIHNVFKINRQVEKAINSKNINRESILENIKNKKVIISPRDITNLFYKSILDNTVNKQLHTLFILFPNEFLSAVYLLTVGRIYEE